MQPQPDRNTACRVFERVEMTTVGRNIQPGRMLVLADDMTGALEAGAKLAGQGIRSLVAVDDGKLTLGLPPDISALVLDTETRHIASDEAERRVYELAKKAPLSGFSTIYKKVDSTLRGNIASELAGLLKACPGSGLLYSPAYPKMGRTVRQGVLYVDGQPVSATEFGFDALNPVTESSIPRLLAPRIPLSIVSSNEEQLQCTSGEAVYVCDAESEEQVQRLARFFVQSSAFRLAAGPAAFLHYLAREIELPRCPPVPLPRIEKALIISSSRHKTSIDQIHYAEERGFPVMDVAPALNPRSGRDWWILRDNSQAAEALDKVANRLAGKAVSILNRIDLDALVVFGGDTAFAVLQALGKPVAHPIGEVLEGIAVSKVKIGMQQFSSDGRGFDRDLVLITKAGGFGPPNVLPAIRKILTAG
jgi:uncharacterized protein YgbK (DUF1537 family)